MLLQVLFHARVAAEARPGFDIDDVAADLVAKLVGRHPHVFAAVRRGHRGADRHRGAPAAPVGGAEAGREAARVQCGRRTGWASRRWRWRPS